VFEGVEALVEEHASLEDVLADPSLHADPSRARKVNQRYAELSAIIRAYRDWQRLGEDTTAAHELATEDPDFAAEAARLDERRAVAEERLRHLLIPRDATDGKDAILEVKSGEGGEESALFAGDLLRMYTRYAKKAPEKDAAKDASK
jgi:peptide chain release factor 1